MAKISDAVKTRFMNEIKEFLEKNGNDVLKVKSGTYSIPWVEGDEEGYLNITFSVPKGSRDGSSLYDGYEEAQNYELETKEKEERKAERERKKREKIERDKKAREEAKRKKEEREPEEKKEG